MSTSSEIISQGIDFLTTHFQGQPIFPRRIYTPIQKQIVVYGINDIIKYFREADFIDCRISAYTYREKGFAAILGEYAPDIIFIDLDKSHFKSLKALDRALYETLKNIKEKFHCNASPSVLSSGGGGYHIIQPLNAIDLKRVDYFTKWSEDPNREFLQFLEPYLSDNRADPDHYHNVSYNNYLLRVPGSINSKKDEEVKILQKWNGVRPEIKYVYGDYLAYLVDKRNQEREIEKQRIKKWGVKGRRGTYPQTVYEVGWIERLIRNGITDFRKDCIRLFLAPYLIRTKNLSYDHALKIIESWLDRCNERQPLSCHTRDYLDKIDDTVRAGFYYVNPDGIKRQNSFLHHLLIKDKIIQ